jgi:HEAT repeat protein
LKLDYCPADVVDAFLLLAPPDNRVLLEIMRDARHPSHVHLTTSLACSDSHAIIQRLVAMLRDADAPSAALQAIAQRTDREFTEFLLNELKHPVPLRVVQNMRRLHSITWLEQNAEALLEMNGRAQEVAVELAVASGIDPAAKIRLLKLFLQQGLGEGRRASCQALAAFEADEATSLILTALRDPDGAVQAAAVRQLRPRRIPNALQLLVERLESPFAEVRDAAKSSLAEFNFTRYRAMFDLLDEQAVRTTGVLVRQVDPTARQQLVEDLSSPSTTTRLRAIEMAVAMSAVDDVRESLISMTVHENAAVRKEAVIALVHAKGPGAMEAVKRATADKIRSVADAARQTLAMLAGKADAPIAATPVGAAK